ncbi:hypothetical protein CEXT_226601 [Caerostris extrusa]|uniref:Uncharacterized protein n=1 Tax=Caerostris extrusa TaxID=172846 RepID=A0AAV4VLS5_CAEEX|nr:hypothetical protein CEXT_226601 [Caerostris extrusa]
MTTIYYTIINSGRLSTLKRWSRFKHFFARNIMTSALVIRDTQVQWLFYRVLRPKKIGWNRAVINNSGRINALECLSGANTFGNSMHITSVLF